MKISIDTESLKELIKEEVESVQKFSCCTGTSLIGMFNGVQVHLVVTNDDSEFMDITGELNSIDKSIIEWQK